MRNWDGTVNGMIAKIRPGDALEVRNIFDAWSPAVAASGIEGTHKDGKKIHDFPIVWVDLAGADGPIPWPLEDVRTPPGDDEERPTQPEG